MKDLFIHLCNFSVVSSVAILIALLLRPLLKKGPSFIRCAFLTLVFLRLLIPVGFWNMPFNVPAIFNTEEKAIETPVDKTPVIDNVTENVIPEYAPQAPVKPPVNDAVTDNSGTVNTPITSTPKEETVTAPDGN